VRRPPPITPPQATIVAERRDQLLRDRAGRTEPAPTREPFERLLELGAVAAQRHLAPPAAEARLDDDREVEVGRLAVLLDQPRLRMRQPGAAQRPRRQHLVVRAQERRRRVEHGDAGKGEPLHGRQPVLDAAEVLAHVEPNQRDVAPLEPQQRVTRREHLDGQPVPRPGGERQARGARAVGDERDAHLQP
jgi:hypothetical protein